MYWDKNFAKFNFANRTSYLPGSCGWSSQIAMCICAYACALTIMQMCQNFTAKKFVEKKFRQQHALAKLAKFFSWGKFPRIRYLVLTLVYGTSELLESCLLQGTELGSTRVVFHLVCGPHPQSQGERGLVNVRTASCSVTRSCHVQSDSFILVFDMMSFVC